MLEYMYKNLAIGIPGILFVWVSGLMCYLTPDWINFHWYTLPVIMSIIILAIVALMTTVELFTE